MEKRLGLKTVICAGIFAGLAGGTSFAAAAQAVDFAGKRVELIAPFAPGGGADVYARALAPFLEKHLPGHPKILVQNIPGGGSVPGANQFEARAKPDGLTALVLSSSTVSNFVFEKSRVQFDLNKWQPVVVSPQGTVVYGAPSLGVRNIKDMVKLRSEKLTFGGKTPTGAELRIVLAMEMLGINVNYVWGVERGEARLALERGEFNISYDTAPAYKKHVLDLVKAGKAVPLFTFGVLDTKGIIVRDPNFPDLPTVTEIYESMNGKKPSGVAYAAFKAVFHMGIMASKGMVLPSATPQPIVDAWRDAVRKIFADPDFQKTAEPIIGGYPQSVGEDARPILREATTFTPETMDWLKKFMKAKLNVNI